MIARVPGTTGYAPAIERFATATDAIAFEELHAAFLDHLPSAPGDVLDVGCGIGRDAAALAQAGHRVVAVEPTLEFLSHASARFAEYDVTWIATALPHLGELYVASASFDFILASAVWHHLTPEEQLLALERCAELLRPGGAIALSLRNGPAGVGSVVYPTHATATLAQAQRLGLVDELHIANEPSLLPGKPDVTWSRLLLRKPVSSVDPR